MVKKEKFDMEAHLEMLQNSDGPTYWIEHYVERGSRIAVKKYPTRPGAIPTYMQLEEAYCFPDGKGGAVDVTKNEIRLIEDSKGRKRTIAYIKGIIESTDFPIQKRGVVNETFRAKAVHRYMCEDLAMEQFAGVAASAWSSEMYPDVSSLMEHVGFIEMKLQKGCSAYGGHQV